MIDAAAPSYVRVPADFGAFGARRRRRHGMYDRPAHNGLTKRPASSDNRAVVGVLALARRSRILADGMTAANASARPTRLRRVSRSAPTHGRSLHLEKVTIEFKPAAPSRSIGRADPPCELSSLPPAQGPRCRRRDRAGKTLARLLSDPGDLSHLIRRRPPRGASPAPPAPRWCHDEHSP